MSVNSKMTALADEVRRIVGVDGTLSIDQMATLLQGVTLAGKTVASVRCVTTGANGWLLGDCNGDGVYTNQDLFAMQTAPLDIADVNGDGVADDDDAQYIGDAVADLLADECLCRVELTYDDGSVDKIVVKAKRTGITPSGSINITQNGTHDVAQYASAEVNVSGSGEEITDGIVINERGLSMNRPLKVTFYGDVVGSIFYTCYPSNELTTIDLTHAVTIGAHAFRNCTQLTTIIGGEHITTIAGNVFDGDAKLDIVNFPKVAVFYDSTFRNCSRLQSATLGSVGHPVTTVTSWAFNGCTQSGLTITAYTTPAYADTCLANIRNGATNATIIIKSSVDGSTIVTSEV